MILLILLIGALENLVEVMMFIGFIIVFMFAIIALKKALFSMDDDNFYRSDNDKNILR